MSSISWDPMTHPHDFGPPFAHAVLANDAEEVARLQERIEHTLRGRHAADPDVFSIRLAVEEALANAIKHGNQMDRRKKVRVDWRLTHDRFEIHVSDEGTGFEPDAIPDPTDGDNLDRPFGRGMFLMRHYMTEVRYNSRGNGVSMVKVLRNGKP